MIGTERLSKVFVELADTLVDEFDVVDLMHVLTERSVDLLGADAAGLMLADQHGGLRLMASTLERMHALEVFELQVTEGPCFDCFHVGEPVVNVDLGDAMAQWPSFTLSAVALGYRATYALPMRLRGQVIGALNLFTEEAAHMSDEDITVGQAMADVATIGLLHERNLREKTVLSQQLQVALDSRVLVEQAKGVLSERADISIGEAFARMRSHARSTRTTLTSVARAVIDGTPAEALVSA